MGGDRRNRSKATDGGKGATQLLGRKTSKSTSHPALHRLPSVNHDEEAKECVYLVVRVGWVCVLAKVSE